MLYVDLFNSKAIAMFAYDLESKALVVHFKAGGVYAYQDVPRVVFDGFRDAPSKGLFFQCEIRDKFAGRRLAPLEIADLERRQRAGGACGVSAAGRVDMSELANRSQAVVFF